MLKTTTGVAIAVASLWARSDVAARHDLDVRGMSATFAEHRILELFVFVGNVRRGVAV